MRKLLPVLNENTIIPKPSTFSWNLERYHAAKKWWRSQLYGTGHFNESLYKRIVELKSIQNESI